MPFGWCGGTKSVRTTSTSLDQKHLQPGRVVAGASQENLDQSSCCQLPGKPEFVKLKSVAASATASDQGTPTTVLAGALPPNPLNENEQYDKVSDIGAGASAFVVLAEDTVTRQQLAIKFIDRGTTAIKTAGKEILNQRLCCMHPNIIQLHEVFLTPEHLGIVSEYAPGGDLVDYIERHNMAYDRALMESEARWLFQQLIVAIDYCHQMGIANRDIKLENTLLMDTSERPVLKLCDFGYSKDELCASISKTMCAFSKYFPHSVLHLKIFSSTAWETPASLQGKQYIRMAGTPEYVAPEVLLYNKYAGKMADLWSCGILLYCMLTGCFPFRRQEDEGLEVQAVLQKMLPRILKADYQRPEGLTPECYDLLGRLLEVNPDKRITVQQVLQHPWLVQDMPEYLVEMNNNLLQIPLSMQTGSCRQSEEEVAALAAKAAQSIRPRLSPGPKNLYY